MAEPIKLNLTVYQGATFSEVLRWESSTKKYIPIQTIEKTAPVTLTLAEEPVGLPLGWRVRVTNVQGMREINSQENTSYIYTDNPEPFKIQFNAVNAVGFQDYQASGVLEYNVPVDLTGYTGRMQIRQKLTDDVVLIELTSANSGILIDTVLHTITIHMTALQTEALDFAKAVYSLELVKADVVVPFLHGEVVLVREVTR